MTLTHIGSPSPQFFLAGFPCGYEGAGLLVEESPQEGKANWVICIQAAR